MSDSLYRSFLSALMLVALTVTTSGQSETPETAPTGNPVGAPPFSTESTVDDYLEYAFKNNRGLRSAAANWQADQEHIDQAGYLDNPELSFEHMVEQRDMSYRVGLSQMLPWFGKLGLKKKIAEAEVERAKYDYETVRLMVFENVIKAFYEYHYLGRSTSVTDDNIALLTGLENVLRARYKAGSATYSDLLKVQVEKDNLLNRRASMDDMRSLGSAKLHSLLGMSVGRVLPWPKATSSGDSFLSDSVLSNMLETLNPELRAMTARIEALSLSTELAKKEYLPDFKLGAGIEVMPETDTGNEPTDAFVMIGISLPIWRGKYKSAVQETSLNRESATFMRQQMENDLRIDLKKALFELRDAVRQIKLLEQSLLPKARQAFEVANQDFMSGATRFMAVIDAQRTLFEFNLMLERARADREIALGEIGCCVGRFDVGTLTKKKDG